MFMSISYTPEIKVEREFEKIDLKAVECLFLGFEKHGKKAIDSGGICFAVKVSTLMGADRLDPYYFHPVHKKIQDKIGKSPYATTLDGAADEIEQKKIKLDEFKEYTIISSIESTRGEIMTERMAGKELPKGIRRVFKKGDIIISRINAKIGCVGLLSDEEEVYATGEYYGFRAKTPTDSVRRFLQLQLRTTEAILQIRRYATGQYLRIAEKTSKKWQFYSHKTKHKK